MAKDLRPTCDNCNRKAKYNIQNWWHLYTCNKDGTYTEDNNWEGDENNHYCEKCAEEEGII